MRQCYQFGLITNASCHAYFGLLLLCGVDDGGAADLGNLTTFTVEGPTADLIPQHVFHKQHAAIKA